MSYEEPSNFYKKLIMLTVMVATYVLYFNLLYHIIGAHLESAYWLIDGFAQNFFVGSGDLRRPFTIEWNWMGTPDQYFA